MLETQTKRIRRHNRVRSKVKGTAQVPRLCVFRSNKHIYAQLIDDEKGKTILSSSDLELKNSKLKTQNSKPQRKTKNLKEKKQDQDIVNIAKVAVAYEVGKLIAKKALEKKIKKVIFDRGGYKYHGRVKAVAEGAREGGLKF